MIIKKSYNTEIANAIHQHLKFFEFPYHFVEHAGTFMFPMGFGGTATALIYHIVVRENTFTCVCRYPLGPSDEHTTDSMMRFLTSANYGLPMGSFEMDDDGKINAKTSCCCHGGVIPTDEMIAACIQVPILLFEKYEPGILNVLFHNWSPDEAIKQCEISEESASSRKNPNAEEVKEAFSLRSFLHRRRSAHEPYAEEAEYTLVENDT